MSDRKSGQFEEEPHRIPTEEEVRWLFQGLVGETPFTEKPKQEDERGLSLLEIRVKDGQGEKEYTYIRSKEPWATGDVSDVQATIDYVYYDEAGMPTDGESVAKLVNGEWRVTPRGPFESTKKFV
jgi:hypothetical protein